MPISLGDGYISIGADLSKLRKDVNAAIALVKTIPNQNVGVGGQGAAVAKATSGNERLAAAKLRAALAAANLAGKVDLLDKALGKITNTNSAKYYNMLARLTLAQNALTKAQDTAATAAKRLADAQAAAADRAARQQAAANAKLTASIQQAALSSSNHAGQLKILRQQLANTTKGTREYYDAITRLNNAKKQSIGVAGQFLSVLGELKGRFDLLIAALGIQKIVQWSMAFGSAANALERTQVTTEALAGSTQAYANVVGIARYQQDLFGGSLERNINSMRGLVPLSRAVNVGLLELSRTSQLLSVLDPTQDTTGAVIALREFLTASQGDAEGARSLAERYELNREALKGIIKSSADAEVRLQALTRLLAQQGITFEAVTAQTNTTAQAYTDLAAAWSNATTAIGSVIAKGFGPLARFLGAGLTLLSDYSMGVAKLADLLNGLTGNQTHYADSLRDGRLAELDQAKATDEHTIALNKLKAALGDAELAQQALAEQTAGVQLAIAKAEIALWPFEDAVKRSRDAVEAQRDAVDDAEEALQPYRDALDDAAAAVDAQQRAIKEAEKALKPFKDAVKEAEDALDEQKRALDDAEDGLKQYKDAVDAAQRALDEQKRAIELAERALRPYEQAVEDAEKAVRDQERALRDAEKALEPYREAVENAQEAVEAQRRQIEQAERALKPYQDAVEAANDRVDEQQKKIRDAERALRPYTAAVEESQKALDNQQAVVDASKESLDEQSQALDEAKRKMSEWANVPLQGSKAFSDKLFDLDQQTAELQLKLLNLRIGKEDHKKSPLEMQLEDVNRQVQETSLRLSTMRTSGQDTSEAEALYKQLRERQDALSTRVALEEPSDDPAVKAIEDQIKALADETQRTQLEEKTTLDPLRHQIEQMGGTPQELSFDEIVAGYQRSKAEVDQLTGSVTVAQAAYDREIVVLDAATAAHKRNEEALAAQEAAIEPLRLKLEEYELAVENANDALERQNDAIDPLREQLVLLQDNLVGAQDALKGADEALDPLRDKLEELQGVAEGANDELARQEALIQPLKDALIPLEDALADANWQLAEQDRLLDPLRTKIGLLEDAVRDANEAYEDANEAIDPLREQLGFLEEAQDAAARALRDHDKMIDPAREKLKLLEEKYDDVTEALDDQREAIDPLRRKLSELGVSEMTIKGQINDAQKALDQFTAAMGTTVTKTAEYNQKLQIDFKEGWDADKPDSITSRVTRGALTLTGNVIATFKGLHTLLTGEGGIMPGIKLAVVSTFGALASESMLYVSGFTGEDAELGVLGRFMVMSSRLLGVDGVLPLFKLSTLDIFKTTSADGLGFIVGLVGDWAAKTGVLGSMYGLWNSLTEKASDIKSAILSPFEGAGAAIGGVMLNFANVAIRGLNMTLAKVAEFGQGIIKSINQVSEWLINKKVIDFEIKPIVIPEIKGPKNTSGTGSAYPGLAVGTDNWQGGWARTGEQGRELAILPKGSSVGNVTYLPQGAAVIPNASTEYILRNLPGFAGGANVPSGFFGKSENQNGFGDAVQRFLDWFANGTEGLVKRAISVVGAKDQPKTEGAFSNFDETMGINYLRFGMRRVFNVADEWLHSNLPKVAADAISGGLQKGGDYWGFLGGMPRGGTPADPNAPNLPAVAGDYPTGIGLDAALNAIISGGYISGYRFSSGHKGIDIASQVSDTIRALIGGRVLASGYNPALEGQYLITQDEVGRGAYYGHMVPGSERYRTGQTIGRGSTIGTMGSSGAAEGKHIHFEMRLNGQSVDPEKVFSGAYQWPFGPDVTGTPPNAPAPSGGAFWPGTPASAQQWLTSAIQAAGVGADWLQGMSILGKYESGWDPNQINLWDSNYAAGYPSRGLAQTIPQTFNANKRGIARPYTGNFGWANGHDLGNPGDIYDPEENLVASINYILRNYGHVNNLRGYKSVINGGGWIGYANGGIIDEPIFGMGASGQRYMFGENGSEMIMPLQDTVSSMDNRFEGMHPKTWDAANQPVIVEERHVTYDLDVHQQRVDNERDLQAQVWTMKMLSPNL